MISLSLAANIDLWKLYLIVFGCQYQCNWLPGKTRLRNDLCVEWDVKLYVRTHSLTLNGQYKVQLGTR